MGDAEFLLQVGVQDTGNPHQSLGGDCIADLTQWQVSGYQSHAQSASGKHHHDLFSMSQVGEEFGVSRKRNTRFVDHAFMHRGGDHSCKVATDAALGRAGQGLQHKGCVSLIQRASGDGGIQGCIPYVQTACRCRLLGPVARFYR